MTPLTRSSDHSETGIMKCSQLLLLPLAIAMIGAALATLSGQALHAEEIIALFSLVVAIIVVLSNCSLLVTTGHECLIERLGQYDRTLIPGLHWIWWPMERCSFHITTREQVLDVPPQQCYTSDNAPLKADAIVYLKIVDAYAAKYNVQGLDEAISNLCLTQLREQMGRLTLEECFSSRDKINRRLLQDLNTVCSGWGVKVARVELQTLEPSAEILAAMELQMAAERKKRAAILQSEGERTTLINQAEGRAEASLKQAQAEQQVMVLQAKGEAQRQEIEAEGMQKAISKLAQSIRLEMGGGEENKELSGANIQLTSTRQNEEAVQAAIQYLSLVRYLESQAKFADSDGTKVIMLPTKDSLPITYEGLKFLMK